MRPLWLSVGEGFVGQSVFLPDPCNWQGWGWRWTLRTHEILGDWMTDWWEMNWWQMPTPTVTPAPLSEPLWDYDSSHLCPLRLHFSTCRRQVNFLGWRVWHGDRGGPGSRGRRHIKTSASPDPLINVSLWGIAGQDCIATGQKNRFHCVYC